MISWGGFEQLHTNRKQMHQIDQQHNTNSSFHSNYRRMCNPTDGFYHTLESCERPCAPGQHQNLWNKTTARHGQKDVRPRKSHSDSRPPLIRRTRELGFQKIRLLGWAQRKKSKSIFDYRTEVREKSASLHRWVGGRPIARGYCGCQFKEGAVVGDHR
jgi:hypothetical protein